MSNANDFMIERGKLLRYMGSDTHVVVPDKVKAISDYAFRRHDEIRSVQLPESVTKIGDYAFDECVLLEQINIPEKVKTIGEAAFRNCCNLQTVTFSGEPEKIGLLAFFGCWKLVQNPPAQLQDFFARMRLGEMTLDEAKKLYVFSKAKGVATVKEFHGVSFKNGNNGKYVYYFGSNEKYLIIPTKIGDLPVVKTPCKNVPENGIVYCTEEVFDKLPRANKAILAVQWLAEDKMLREELTEKIQVFIKKYIDDVAYALNTCDDPVVYQRFLEIAKPKAALLEKLVEQCSEKAAILAVLLGADSTPKRGAVDLTLDEKPKLTVTELKKLWTYRTYTISETGEKVAELTNYKGHEKHVEIPEYIGKNRVAVAEVIFPAEVESVEFPNEKMEIKCRFRNCRAMVDSDGFIVINVGSRRILTDYVGPKDIGTLTIPDGVTENLSSTFSDINMREVIIPEGFLELAFGSFKDCKKLQRVRLPESLRSIGLMAFQNCDALRQLYIPKGVTEIGILDLNRYKPELLTVYGEKGSKAQEMAERYRYTFVEGYPAENNPIPDFVILDGELSQYLGTDTDVMIPEGVTVISRNAFRENLRIRSVTMPDCVQKLEMFAFEGCTGLEQVKLSAQLTEIPNYAFMGCTALQAIAIPEGVTTIGDTAFSMCRALTEVSLPSGLKIIADNAFSACFALADITIPVTVEAIGVRAFQNAVNQQKTAIHAPAGSYAETYAKENNILFVAE